ncbi:MAG: hypothetical protein AB1437_07970 [Pseudomonadota bacterium]
MMDYHATSSKGILHICTVHRHDLDESPVQIISAQKLAYFERIEAAYLSLCDELEELLSNTSSA